MLEVKLVRLSGLRSEDLLGQSDPFVLFRVSARVCGWREGVGVCMPSLGLHACLCAYGLGCKQGPTTQAQHDQQRFEVQTHIL